MHLALRKNDLSILKNDRLIIWSFTSFILIVMHIACFGEGNDNPLQYCCLENPLDRGAL